MAGKNRLNMIVIDAGGRYGIHPTWKTVKGDLAYYLFEPDAQEAERLSKKYQNRKDEITVKSMALGDKDGEMRLDIFKNKAMSSSAKRTNISSLFQGQREEEVSIIKSVICPVTTIDTFCDENSISPDFLKLDTEGSEFEILQGAEKALKNSVLAVRSEVAFDYIFEGKKLFNDIHEYLMENNFFLMNLDYRGAGDYQVDQVRYDEPHGILTSTDAVWVKRFSEILTPHGTLLEKTENVVKLATFCFLNNSPDVSLRLLLEAIYNEDIKLSLLEHTQSYRRLDKLIHEHFYRLKWCPGQSLIVNSELYFRIFGKEMKVLNEFMEDLALNPE